MAYLPPASSLEEFKCRIKHAEPFLLSILDDHHELLKIKNWLDTTQIGRREKFNWFAYHIPGLDGVEEHVAIHLQAHCVEDGDIEARAALMTVMPGSLHMKRSIKFSILLHYKDYYG